MKIILRVFAGLIALLVVGAAALMLTFTAATLEVKEVQLGDLPPAAPPQGMSIVALPTGSMESRAAFAFRGGSFSDIRQFSMTALLVKHPKGNLLIDTGFGQEVDKHIEMLPGLMQTFSTFNPSVPAARQLAANGITPGDLAGVILTHAHWDHVSGLDSLGSVPVMVNGAETGFIAEKTRHTELLNSLKDIRYRQYEFDGGPYLGFPSSHDVWGDGSLVIVPAPGHTPGSVVVFINLPTGTRYALLGDMVWQMEAIDLPAERPWPVRRMLGEDDDRVRENIIRIAAIHKRFPEIRLIPAHDERAFVGIPVFPVTAN